MRASIMAPVTESVDMTTDFAIGLILLAVPATLAIFTAWNLWMWITEPPRD